MPLGGFAPCPLPLGGTVLDGLLVEQHARLSTDLRSIVQTAPFAVVHFNTSSATPLAYLGQNDVGVLAAPTITSLGVGDARLLWDVSYLDEYDNAWAVDLSFAVACGEFAGGVQNAYAVVELETAQQIRVRTYSIVAGVPVATDVSVSLVVW